MRLHQMSQVADDCRGGGDCNISLKRKRESYPMSKKMPKSLNKAFGGDHRLLPRLIQLANDQRYSEYLDEEELISDLLHTYPEYKRKKKNALKFAVQKALHLRASNFRDGESSEEEIPENFADIDSDFSSNMGKYIAYEDTNLINKGLSGLYKKTQLEKESESSRSHPAILNTPCSSISAHSKKNDEKPPNISTLKNSEREKTRSAARKSENSSENKVALTTFADIGGLEETLKDICKLLVHLKHPEIYQAVGVNPPRGFLLHGPPGCGKTLIAHAIAGELCLPFIEVAATELVSGVSGESESKIRELFDRAVSNAPCILFIDEIDAITPKREFAQKEMEKRIVAQLLKSMDDLNRKDASTQVMVIGATNRPDSLDPALRRAGRFDREISVGIPDENARMRILQVLCNNLRLAPGFNFQWLAKNTPGYVGADLMAITREAAVAAISRLFQQYVLSIPHGNAPHILNELNNDTKSTKNPLVTSIDLQAAISWLKDLPPLNENQLQELYVEVSDFEAALEVYQPSAKREGFATIPNVTWDDIGALKEAREVLQTAILLPIKNRDEFEKLKLSCLSGVLLCGPKGCGKTLLAKAVANECSINFLSVKGPELLSMYVGESERAVRQCFERARNSAPCVIFFDEIDALCPSRSSNSENAVADRVVNQLLTEIDGVESKKQIFVMGATNRPDNIDSAMLRSGRLEHILYINLPTPEDRKDILKTITKNGTHPKIAEDVDLELLAMDRRCDGFSGADLTSLVRQASLTAFADHMSKKEAGNQHSDFKISWSHFEKAFLKVKPSVSEKECKFFKDMALDYSGSKREKL